MCTRFTTVRANMTGSSDHVGLAGAGQHIGLVPNGVSRGPVPPVAGWHLTDIEAEPAALTPAGAADEFHFSVLTLTAETI